MNRCTARSSQSASSKHFANFRKTKVSRFCWAMGYGWNTRVFLGVMWKYLVNVSGMNNYPDSDRKIIGFEVVWTHHHVWTVGKQRLGETWCWQRPCQMGPVRVWTWSQLTTGSLRCKQRKLSVGENEAAGRSSIFSVRCRMGLGLSGWSSDLNLGVTAEL